MAKHGQGRRFGPMKTFYGFHARRELLVRNTSDAERSDMPMVDLSTGSSSSLSANYWSL
jgi:hypothetical protein